MNRRSLLCMLGAAPIAAPAMAQTALAPKPPAIFVDMEWADYGRAMAAWMDENRDCIFASGASTPPASVERVADVGPGSIPSSGLAPSDSLPARPLPSAAPHPFLDDVGSGP